MPSSAEDKGWYWWALMKDHVEVETSLDILDFGLDIHNRSWRRRFYMQKHKVWLLMIR
jgi:hypothetical protein